MTTYGIAARVQVRVNEKWYPGTVISISNEYHQVVFDKPLNGFISWIGTVEDMQPENAKWLHVGRV